MVEFESIDLNSNMVFAVIEPYIAAFEGHPWWEIYRCVYCGEAYGINDDAIKFTKGVTCRNDNCQKPLELVSYWKEGGKAEKTFMEAVNLPGFVGKGAQGIDTSENPKYNNKLLGVSWGYKIPTNNTETVKFEDIRPFFQRNDIDPDTVFYAAETAVHPNFQGQGIGTAISRSRLREARDNGFAGATVRTINRNVVKQFEKFFGEGNVRPLFNDPDPVKNDRIWYYCPFRDFES